MRFYYYLGCILSVCFASCSTRSNVPVDSNETSSEAITDSINEKYATIFGTTIPLNEGTAIRELSKAGILQIDTINEKDGEFENAIIDFAGVTFGLNKGFLFLTSRQDKQAIDFLINRISKYYGEPSIDDGDVLGEPKWSYYHWNLYDTVPDKPYILIRPLHSGEGGLVMTWRFNTYTDL